MQTNSTNENVIEIAVVFKNYGLPTATKCEEITRILCQNVMSMTRFDNYEFFLIVFAAPLEKDGIQHYRLLHLQNGKTSL